MSSEISVPAIWFYIRKKWKNFIWLAIHPSNILPLKKDFNPIPHSGDKLAPSYLEDI